MIIKGALLFLFGTVLVSGNLYKSGKYRPQLKSINVLSPKKYGQSSEVVVSEIKKSTGNSRLTPVQAPHFESVRTVPLKHWKPKNVQHAYVKPEISSTRNIYTPAVNKYKPNDRIIKKYKQKAIVQTDPLLSFAPLRTNAEEKKEILWSTPVNNIEKTFVNQMPIIEEKIEAINPPTIIQELPLLVLPDSSVNSGPVHVHHNIVSESEFSSNMLTKNDMVEPCLTPLLSEEQVVVHELVNPVVLPQSALSSLVMEPASLSMVPETIKHEIISSPIELPINSMPFDLELPKKTLLLSESDRINAVSEEHLLSEKDMKPAVIPSAPELPPLVLPEAITVDVAETPLIETMIPISSEIDSKPIVVPEAPELPPLTIPEVVINEYVVEAGLPEVTLNRIGETSQDSLSETVLEPISIPNLPELSPLVLPEAPKIDISEEQNSSDCVSDISEDSVSSLADDAQISTVDLQAVVIPEAPELPPLVLAEVPLAPEIETFSEVEQSTSEGILLDDSLTDTFSKPILISDALELPQLSLPEPPLTILHEEKPIIEIELHDSAEESAEAPVPEIITEHKLIPEPPQLSPIDLPQILTEEKVTQFVSIPIAFNDHETTLCDESVSAIESKPLLIPNVPELPPLHLPEPVPALSTEEDVGLESVSEVSQNTDLSDFSDTKDHDANLQFTNIPAAPELPPLNLPHVSIPSETEILVTLPEVSDKIDESSDHDLPEFDLKPLLVSNTQSLPPLTLPVAPIRIITEELTKASDSLSDNTQNLGLTSDVVELHTSESHFLPAIIPEAPVLPPFVMPKLPPLIYSETPVYLQDNLSEDVHEIDETPLYLTSLIDKDTISTIPKVVELPPLTLPEAPVKLLIKNPQIDSSTNTMSKTQTLSKIPYKHVIDKLTDASIPEISAGQTLIEEINLKPINIPEAPILPLFELPKLPAIDEAIESNSYMLQNPVVEVIEPLQYPKIPKLPPLSLPIPIVLQKESYAWSPETEDDSRILCAEEIEEKHIVPNRLSRKLLKKSKN